MAKIEIINADCFDCTASADMVFTDPPFDMTGKMLAKALSRYQHKHLVLITTMKQFIEFSKETEFDFAFDFVIDALVPKKSKSIRQPNYTHQTGVYMKAKGARSAFNRKIRQRSDTFDNNGYWPTLIRAPRNNMQTHGMAKNETAIADILGSFDISSIIDPFSGIGTAGIAANELGIDCLLIEREKNYCDKAAEYLKLLCINFVYTKL